MEILLLFAAPVIQLILSVLKIMRKISTSIFIIFCFAMCGGIVNTFITMNLVMSGISKTTGHRITCGLPGTVVLFGGIFITVIGCSAIGLICWSINYCLRRYSKIEDPATHNLNT